LNYTHFFLASDKRLTDITYLFANPVHTGTSTQDEDEDQPEEISASMLSTTMGSSGELPDISSGITPKPSTGSFHFMQESELETALGDSTEWVVPDAVGPASEDAGHGGGQDSVSQSFVEEPEVGVDNL
jgi:hypothetical protein